VEGDLWGFLCRNEELKRVMMGQVSAFHEDIPCVTSGASITAIPKRYGSFAVRGGLSCRVSGGSRVIMTI